MSKKITGPILVLAGATLGTCMSYTPVAKEQPTQAIIAQYIKDGRYCAAASEQRKREILTNIGKLRKQIRQKARMIQLDKETRVRPVTDKQRTMVYAIGILNTIADKWEQKHNN